MPTNPLTAEVRAALRCVNYPRKVVTVGDPNLPTNGDPMDDWLLASYGNDDSMYARDEPSPMVTVHVTTDHVRASETRGTAINDAEWDAKSPGYALALCDALDAAEAERDRLYTALESVAKASDELASAPECSLQTRGMLAIYSKNLRAIATNSETDLRTPPHRGADR